jgi:hypothetical protein
MKFLTPNGIGDVTWALTKVQAIRDKQDSGGKIEMYLACGDKHDLIQKRAVDFVRRFAFVDSCETMVAALVQPPPVTPRGYYNYLEDGWYEFYGERYCVLTPNAPLERGIRLEEWLPQYAIDWNIFDQFRIDDSEWSVADKLLAAIGPYACFYPGPLNGNTRDGHNRNGLWSPGEWVALGHCIKHDFGLPIVAVGASYDRAYYDQMIQPLLGPDKHDWIDMVGYTSIGDVYAITSRAKFLISYQAGVGIVATYLGTPTGIFWRCRGDSISPECFLSFENQMASAWVPPAAFAARTHLPLIYTHDTVSSILTEIHSRGWATCDSRDSRAAGGYR